MSIKLDFESAEMKTSSEYQEALKISEKIFYKEKLFFVSQALEEAACILIFQRMEDEIFPSKIAASEKVMAIMKEITLEEITNVLIFRLNNTAEYYSYPEVKYIVSKRQKVLDIMKEMPNDFDSLSERKQFEIIQEISDYQKSANNSRKSSLTKADREVMSKCDKIAKRIIKAEGLEDEPVEIIIDAMIIIIFENHGRTDLPLPKSLIYRVLKQRLKNPSAYQQRIENTRPIADLYRSGSIYCHA